MIIGTLQDKLTLEAARERLCAQAKGLGPACHGSLLPAVYRAALTHAGSLGHHRRKEPPDHSTDAIIYVTVVVVFYAAIIVLLLTTNFRRRRQQESARKKHVVVFDVKKGTTEQVPAKQLAKANPNKEASDV